mmetsp:Transcript_41782/g.103838  ORF Transcript_41782/g.103838 Transcript_41782/m.103838 type:complete len:355 (+) Transcript_41782:127-1191(+)
MQIIKVGNFETNLQKKLGDGGFGAVFRAKDLSENPPVECAAKLVKLRSQQDVEAMEHEVDVLKAVAGHPSVISLRGYIEMQGSTVSKKDAWLFMELATGGELFDRLIDSGNLSEKATWPFAKGLVDGVLHCHSKGVIHRDVKLENIMLCAEDPCAVKLIDFGLAAITPVGPNGVPERELLYDAVGTKSYRAPEIAGASKHGYYGPPVDVWSMGIVIFSLVSGFFPLEEAKMSDWRYAKLAQDQSRGIGPCDSIYATYKRACPFTEAFRDLVDKMLTINPDKRLSLTELARHPWFDQAMRPKEPSFCYEEDAYNDPVVYRSANAFDDEEGGTFEPPMEAMRIARQPAMRGDVSDL